MRIFIIMLLCVSSISCQKKSNGSADNPTHSCSDSDDFYELKPALKNYSEDNSWESTINHCLYHEDGCTVGELPLIGWQKDVITKEDILARTVVDEKWLYQRFKDLLDRYPDELIQMFGSVTAVVLSTQVKPSHYWSVHGAIVLDAEYFWIHEEEEETLSEEEDCRSNNFRKSDINYSLSYRMVIGEESFWAGQRGLDYVERDSANLLFHELAHAMDYTVVDAPEKITPDMKIWEIDDIDEAGRLSQRLQGVNGYPLISSLLYDSAQYFYKGKDATPQMKQVSFEQLGNDFGASGAVHLYSYTTHREDFAMLLEAYFTNRYYKANYTGLVLDVSAGRIECQDKIVKWSHEQRDFSPKIRSRMDMALEAVQLDHGSTLDLSGVGGDVIKSDYPNDLNLCDYRNQ